MKSLRYTREPVRYISLKSFLDQNKPGRATTGPVPELLLFAAVLFSMSAFLVLAGL